MSSGTATPPVRVSSKEVFTKEIEFTASFHALTSPQWQLVRSFNWWSVAIGIAVSCMMSYAIPYASAWLNGIPAHSVAKTNLAIGAIIAVLALIVGYMKDSKRRKMISTIDRVLLSDDALGIDA